MKKQTKKSLSFIVAAILNSFRVKISGMKKSTLPVSIDELNKSYLELNDDVCFEMGDLGFDHYGNPVKW